MARLRMLAWQGGVTMAVRQILGMVISFVGLVAVARMIGPQAYGIYVSALALHTFLVLFFQWGTDVFLLRHPSPPQDDHVAQALALALVLGGIGAMLGWPVGRLAERWIGSPGVALAVATLFAGMPLQLAALVPSALLQRRMAYRPVAWAELSGQAALYGVAVTAAAAGWGLRAPLAGWWAQLIVQTAALFALAGWRPRLIWRRALLSQLLSYGMGYSAAIWVWQLRTLVNPLIVARVLGPEAAAGVAVAVRLVDSLSFMRMVLWRVAMPALGRLQGDRPRLAAAVAEGSSLLILAVAPVLAAFAAILPWLVPLAFGRGWSTAAVVFPFLALGALGNGLFSLQSSALLVLGRNLDVAAFHAVHVALLAGVAALLVPRLGVLGFGLAETAALASYPLLQWMARRALGPVDIALPLSWAAGFGLALFGHALGPAVMAGPLAALALPASRRAVLAWWAQLKEATHG